MLKNLCRSLPGRERRLEAENDRCCCGGGEDRLGFLLPELFEKAVGLSNLPLGELAKLRCTSKGTLQRVNTYLAEDTVQREIIKLAIPVSSASSLSVLAREEGVGLGSIKARHDELVGHFKALAKRYKSFFSRHNKRFSAEEKAMIEGFSLSKDITALNFASQLKDLERLETNYNYRVLAHEVGTQCGEGGVSYDVLKGKSGEELKGLIEGFSNKGDVQQLDLGNKDLTALPEGVFSGLGNLEVLYLSGNKLTELPVGVFTRLVNLAMLCLEGNKLTELPEGVFAGLGNLQQLYLFNNNLEALPEGVFNGLDKLQVLYLSSNKLKELPVGVFNGLDALWGLLLSNNQLTEEARETLRTFGDAHLNCLVLP